ncbi:MAG: TIGR00730 family Rossman fold protein [Bacteroidales bacterium]|nr:TIGR00730 family Rossman fold protein [Bacteroidales bacterium]
MKKISVFCGSSPGNSMIYTKTAQKLAIYLANNNITLIYGGSKVGLMGELANEALLKGGNVIGIIPKHLKDKEVAHTELSELRVVDTMHQRKKMMEELSDAFIALPGGLGTTEEIFEMLTWAQLNLHKKPCAFVNVNGYFNFLIDFLNNMVLEGFLEKEYRDMIIIEDNIETIFDQFTSYKHPIIDKAKIAIEKLDSK